MRAGDTAGVGGEHLKLTAYFGERERTAHGLLADELLSLYGAHGLRASVLLRGSEGFGAHHRLRADRLLTLSEDLPVLAIALDRRERIEAVLDEVLALKRRGLVTLERVRLPHGASEPDVPTSSGAVQLTVYVGRRERVGGVPAFAAVTALLHTHGVAGATTLLGVDGTREGRRVRARFFAANADVPTIVLAVGEGERIAAALPRIERALPGAPISIERVRVCKRDGELLEVPHELSSADAHGRPLWQKLTVYSSQAATHEGRPLAAQVVRALREAGAAGATSIRGVWGFHGDHSPHGDRLLQLRRHVPVVTIVIDTPERIARSFAIVDALTAEHGLVTSELVPAVRTPGEGEEGMELAAP